MSDYRVFLFISGQMNVIALYTSVLLMVLLSACSSENSQTVAEKEIRTSTSSMEKGDSTNQETNLRILFLGDSITAGYGLGEDQAFPALVQTELDRNGYRARAVNAGISGDTSTGGLNRIDWLIREKVDILILELGGNDGLRGIDLSLTKSNLISILERTQKAWPDAELIVAGMMIPTNLGHEYTQEFSEMYPVIAEQFKAQFIPFTYQGLEGISEHMQPDGIHPTEEGHRIIAAALWKTLEPLVQRLS